MRALLTDLGTWPIAVACLVTALVLPIAAVRQMTPDLLREHYVLSKPGRVIAAAVLLLVVLVAHGAAMALAAVAYPSLWAVEAVTVSGAAVVIVYLVRYRAAARACTAELLLAADEQQHRSADEGESCCTARAEAEDPGEDARPGSSD